MSTKEEEEQEEEKEHTCGERSGKFFTFSHSTLAQNLIWRLRASSIPVPNR